MTEKQEKILQSALELFAREGFHATSTSKVAKHAGVSEGLIFRHFSNKDGLLEAILELGKSRINAMFVDIVMDNNPKSVIRKCIEMPLLIDKSEHDFWKLQFKLKWELEISGDEKMEPVKMALTNAFAKLEYKEPEMEAILILLFIEGIASSVLKGSEINTQNIMNFLIEKYNL